MRIKINIALLGFLYIFLLIFFFFSPSQLAGCNQDINEIEKNLSRGRELYNQANFKESIDIFETSLEESKKNFYKFNRILPILIFIFVKPQALLADKNCVMFGKLLFFTFF